MNDEDKTSQNTYTVSIGGNTQSMTYTLDDYSSSSISTLECFPKSTLEKEIYNL